MGLAIAIEKVVGRIPPPTFNEVREQSASCCVTGVDCLPHCETPGASLPWERNVQSRRPCDRARGRGRRDVGGAGPAAAAFLEHPYRQPFFVCAEHGRAACVLLGRRWRRTTRHRGGTRRLRRAALRACTAGRRWRPRFSSIATGATHACAIDPAGELFCWGAGQRVPARISLHGEVSAIAAGEDMTCAVDSEGTWCWTVGPPAGTPARIPLDQSMDLLSGRRSPCVWGHNRPWPALLVVARGARSRCEGALSAHRLAPHLRGAETCMRARQRWARLLLGK